MSDEWTTIESDPGVFTELIERMGCRGVEVSELWSVDADSLEALEPPVYGLIFLFKWVKEQQQEQQQQQQHGGVGDEGGDGGGEGEGNGGAPDVFFARQVITNACATQAIVSVLLNAPRDAPGLDLGPELTALRDFAAALPPDVRGLALGNCEAIRAAHNSFRPPAPLVPEDDDDDAKKKGDAFHFVAYVPAAGSLWELDGLRPGPTRLGALAPGGGWLGAAARAVQARIARYGGTGELRFNLMAVVGDRSAAAARALAAAEAAAAAGGGDAAAAAALEAERARGELAAEAEKRARWRDENVRRRTDYVPFAFRLLAALAGAGRLEGAAEAAERAGAARREARRAAEAAGGQ